MRHSLVAVSVLWTMTAYSLSPVAAQTNSSDPLHRIKHVVVLMLENRSFDHVLGLFDHNPDLNGLANYMNVTNAANLTDPDRLAVKVSAGSAYISPFNPEHDVAYVTEQIFGTRNVRRPYPDPPPMNGFVQDGMGATNGSITIAGSVMQAFTPDQLPVTLQLAKEYAIIDRWFSSVPGPTQPNRAYFHSCTSHGEVDNHIWHMRTGYPQKSIFQSLTEAGKRWMVYFHDYPSAFLFRWMRRASNFPKLSSFIKNFAKDCRDGKLPEYTVIEPRFFDKKKSGLFGKAAYANDDHPPHDMRRGQDLIKDVYEAVRSSPTWNSTLLIITYDEHGGYFDHVPTPVKDIPNPDGIAGDGINFDRLGVRVPTLVISPWIKKGTVFHGPPASAKPFASSEYEHSSIPATLKKLFGMPEFLTKRDAWAATLEGVWSELSAPRTDTPTTLVNAPPYMVKRSVQEGPYRLDVDGEMNDMQQAVLESMRGLQGDMEGDAPTDKVEAYKYLDRVMGDTVFAGRTDV